MPFLKLKDKIKIIAEGFLSEITDIINTFAYKGSTIYLKPKTQMPDSIHCSFKFECPKTWESLEATKDEDVNENI